MLLKVKKEGNVASFGLVCDSCQLLVVEKFRLSGTGFALLTKVIPDMKHEMEIPGQYTCPDCAHTDTDVSPERPSNEIERIAEGIKR